MTEILWQRPDPQQIAELAKQAANELAATSERREALLHDDMFVAGLLNALEKSAGQIDSEALHYSDKGDLLPPEYDVKDFCDFCSIVLGYAEDNRLLVDSDSVNVAVTDGAVVTLGAQYGQGVLYFAAGPKSDAEAAFALQQARDGETLPGVAEGNELLSKFGEYVTDLLEDGTPFNQLAAELFRRQPR